MVTIPIRDRTSEDPAARSTMRVPLILPHELLHFLSVLWTSENICLILCKV